MPVKIPSVGSKVEVYHGNALHTAGGLFKKDLIKNPKSCKIMSRRKHLAGLNAVRNGTCHLGAFLVPKGPNRGKCARSRKLRSKSKKSGTKKSGTRKSGSRKSGSATKRRVGMVTRSMRK